jgi:hypothetical protein
MKKGLVVRLYENPDQPGEWIIDRLIPKWNGISLRPAGKEYDKQLQFTNLKSNAYYALKEASK